MRRPQFGLKTLLWLVLCVACFLGGRFIRLKGEDERLASQLSETIGLQRLLQTEQRMLQRAINARGNDADAAKADWERAQWTLNQKIQEVNRLRRKAAPSASTN